MIKSKNLQKFKNINHWFFDNLGGVSNDSDKLQNMLGEAKTSFDGDGAKLTGLPAGWNWVDGSLF